jgi:hypothetical protein
MIPDLKKFYFSPRLLFLKMHTNFIKSFGYTFIRGVKSTPIKYFIVVLFFLSFAISLQCYLISIGKEYTRYNNYVIFKYAFNHLLQHENLYLSYPNEYNDLYKYSPSFALFMGLFNWMPDWLGVFLFNFFNLSVFLIGLIRLRFTSEKLKWILLFLFVEIGITSSSLQTNLLMAGCIMLAFSFFEEDKLFPAALLITCTVFIKIFGVVAYSLFLFYPKKIRFILFTILIFIGLSALPLLVTSPSNLLEQYSNWWILLQNDYSASLGISFMGWTHAIFDLEFDKRMMVIIAAIIYCIPLLKTNEYRSIYFRRLLLSSLLIWVVIFNHKGESSTYIIAMAGAAIWYFSQKPDTINLTLLWLCLLFTSFSSTEGITPLWIQRAYVSPLALKAVFCSIIWFKIIFDMMTHRHKPGILKPQLQTVLQD